MKKAIVLWTTFLLWPVTSLAHHGTGTEHFQEHALLGLWRFFKGLNDNERLMFIGMVLIFAWLLLWLVHVVLHIIRTHIILGARD